MSNSFRGLPSRRPNGNPNSSKRGGHRPNENLTWRRRDAGSSETNRDETDTESRRKQPHYARNARNQDNYNYNRENNSNNRDDNSHSINNSRRHADLPPHRPRPERTMGFTYTQKLLENDNIEQVVFNLFRERNGFVKLLDSGNMNDDLIVLLVKLLWKICGSTFPDTKTALLNAALKSRFMEKLISYINSIMSQNQNSKRRNKCFWDDPDEFWSCLIHISRTVQQLIPSNCESIKNLLTTMSVFIPLIEQAHSLHISDNIKMEIDGLIKIGDKLIEDIEVKKRQVCQRNTVEELEPPEDFRQIEIIPSTREVTDDTYRPFLRENIVDKAFRSINDYLDIQFRLLREDFVAPLRRGISTYLNNQKRPKHERKKLDDVKIYNPIKFVNVETLNECTCYKIRFDFGKQKRSFTYENSKRFMFGSLVCFTNDNFITILFGKIVGRDIKLLEEGMLIVGFQGEVEVKFETDYLMVESSVYFEPYYQVLGVLKQMDTTTFPMEKYIIRVDSDPALPKYLQKPALTYKIQNATVFAARIPSNRFYNFNDSQLSAFKAALTNEFCIVQGPPGTGKTYLALKIAHTLLKNHFAWYEKTPILVICYTNHALDQFLTGLLPATDNILRVGGQSKDADLQKYNLVKKRRNYIRESAVIERMREVQDCKQKQENIRSTLNHIEANDGIISFTLFKDVIEDYNKTWFATAKGSDIRKWLLEGKMHYHNEIQQRNNLRQAQEQMQNLRVEETPAEEQLDDSDEEENVTDDDWFDDAFDGIEAIRYASLLTLQEFENKLKLLRTDLQKMTDKPDELDDILTREKLLFEMWETQTDLDYLKFQMESYQEPRMRQKPNYIDLINPHNMPHSDRWQLYYYWLNLYQLRIIRIHDESSKKFREVYRIYNEMRDMEDINLMKDHMVVGMTTTGAARLQSSLQALRSPIVIVEEAAEVLEAHIIAALTNHCQHLILIGDHLQLKPSAADYKIETKYKLGISLFERMVRNNIKCHTLNVQHRMKPEISKLIKPHIYRNLDDHESTLTRPPILGIEKCLYFINHQEQEEICQDASKKNLHESRFLIALARHLILNGYKPEQITILAAYLGQFFEMAREKKKPHNRMLLQDVRISVLDNYQGEESDIILLSLVRSNAENKAGFLRIQNRVCVALSRARDGFYIMGNMTLLKECNSENEIWKKVNAELERQHAIGTHLTLRCQIHPYKFTSVSKSDDFDKLSEGGCDQLCEAQISCGHVCKRLCHVQDRNHQLYKCNENCTKLLCDDLTHLCLKRCFEDCGLCTYLVPRHLEACGHTVHIACHIDPTQYKCQKILFTKLPCGHETDKPCSADPLRFKCPFPCDTRVEPCGHPCDRKCHVRVDPDHLKYICQQPCGRPSQGCKKNLEDGKHICTRFCYQECEECNVKVRKLRSCSHMHDVACKEDVENIKCVRRCKKILSCGHKCKSKCEETCKPCDELVNKVIPECGHTVRIKCSEMADRSRCKSRICPRLLPCGHKCTNHCNATCTSNCNEMVQSNLQTPCGHVIKNIECYLRNTIDPSVLRKKCLEPCRTQLVCGHTCTGTCGECQQSRVHKRCTAKCGVPLVCNHECPIPCRESCKPCTKPCEMSCRHSKCKKKCGEPCTPCTARCLRRCPHVTCTRLCGEICDVEPCQQTCKKSLRCGHQCVGFCGDPCPPLCRICNYDELTEIFFGTEDDEDAIFVLLRDCKHVLEHTGLEEWLKQGEDEIKFKSCPKCKRNISTTERYSKYIKEAVRDVILAKQISFGNLEHNNNLRGELFAQILELQQSSLLIPEVNRKLEEVFSTLLNRLNPTKNGRIQPINKVELNAIQSKVQTLKHTLNCFKEIKKFSPDDVSLEQLEIIQGVLMRSDDYVTNQEVADLELEIKRLQRMVEFDIIKKMDNSKYILSSQPDVRSLVDNIRKDLCDGKRYLDTIDSAVKSNLKDLAKKIDSSVTITEKERIEIVKAIGLQKGHWYKCPNGHPYAIGECGGANQIAKCFCGAAIGGRDHHLLPSNQFAGEMDNADRHAWPGGLY